MNGGIIIENSKFNNLTKEICDKIITGESVTREEVMQMQLKIKYVQQVHKAKISHHTGTKEYYYTRLPNRKEKKAKTELELYLKLFEYYSEATGCKYNYDVAAIFEVALLEAEKVENIKPRTVSRKHQIFDTYFLGSKFSSITITEVIAPDIQEFLQNLVRSRDIKDKEFDNIWGILNMIFRYTIIHDVLQKNPMQLVNKEAYKRSCNHQKKALDDAIFSPQEIEAIKEYSWKKIDRVCYRYSLSSYAILLACETGMRVGELPALKWTDINFEDRYIWIHGQQLETEENGHTVYYYEDATKNEKGRSRGGRKFPMTKAIEEILIRLWEAQKAIGLDAEWVFEYQSGDWITVRSIDDRLRDACKKLGLTASGCHSIRRSLNSNVLIEKGFNAEERAKLLGHSAETNQRYYSFARKDFYEDALERLEESQTDSQDNPKIINFIDVKKPGNPVKTRGSRL
jgi:integrase